MMPLVLVGIGGATGSVARFLIGRALADPTSVFPLATLVVNVAGCLCIGAVAAWAERSQAGMSAEAWALVVTGFLGGFTTFSAFGYETIALWRTNPALSAANVALQLGFGLAAVLAGRAMVRLVAG
jgi:CrcB protein